MHVSHVVELLVISALRSITSTISAIENNLTAHYIVPRSHGIEDAVVARANTRTIAVEIVRDPNISRVGITVPVKCACSRAVSYSTHGYWTVEEGVVSSITDTRGFAEISFVKR